MPPTLFLDFDGVLHPTHAGKEEYFCKMNFLKETLAGLDIAIVISSSWRFHHAADSLVGHFPDEVRRRIAGVTGSAFIGRHARWNEIQAYVAAHRIQNWRALDDSRFEFPSACKELILCNASRGIETEQAERIRDWLRQT